ncbi:MAG TPA: HAD-IA family hydrolase [Vicinamibacterales bacterium]|nr:HAD-IA family hydrolase [Vicinamibacterales bacterium]
MIIALDLDGTLIDSARDIAESISEMLQDYGAAPLPMTDVVQMVGEGAPLLVRRALKQSGLSAPADEALSRFMSIYDRRLMDHTIPYDGVAESLSLALQRGPLAVLTNKPLGPSIGILEALGLRGFFSRIIGGDGEYGRKPDPAGLLALQALAPGDRIVMVGDSPADWKVAEAAAVPFVFARYGFGASKFAEPPTTPFVMDHARELDRTLGAIER